MQPTDVAAVYLQSPFKRKIEKDNYEDLYEVSGSEDSAY